MAAFFFVLRSGGWHWAYMPGTDDPLYLQATTACLSAIVVMQIANVFLCRSERDPLHQRRLMSNKLVLAGVVMENSLIALIDYTPWGNAVFGTAPIPLTVWLFIIPFAFGMVALEELRKWFVRSHGNQRATTFMAKGQSALRPRSSHHQSR